MLFRQKSSNCQKNNSDNQKKSKIAGKLVSLELAGPKTQCRQYVTSILEPLKFTGIGIQLLDAELNDQYKRNLDRLADVQSNI